MAGILACRASAAFSPMLPASASGVRDVSSITCDGPEVWISAVTTLSPGAKPRSTCSGVHDDASSSASAKQSVYLPGQLIVARSVPPGRCPPMLRTTNRTARPIVALARLPWPSAPCPEFMPI